MAKLSIEDVTVGGRRVLMRVDFNVPQDEQGRITDDRRIRAALPTIRSVRDRGGKVILMSHLGRPKGAGYDAKYTLKPAAHRLSELLGAPVAFPSTDCIDETSAQAVKRMSDGAVLLLENLRFHKEEEANDAAFSAKLATLGDVYCDDAFGTAHRAHASMVGVPNAMPPGTPKAAGLLLLAEIRYLSDTMAHPQRPFVAILGGAKVSDKIVTIRRLLDKVDAVLIGGAMAYTFLQAMGTSVGNSRVEKDFLKEAKEILDLARRRNATLMLPDDHLCGREFNADTSTQVFKDQIAEGWMGLDIGPATLARYQQRIGSAKTILWNGPVGVFEMQPFSTGTRGIAQAIVKATKEQHAVSIVGGGDTAAAVESFDLADGFSHVSTGGGASLELLEGKELPGISVLTDVN